MYSHGVRSGQTLWGNKLLTDLAGKPLIQWALDASAGLFAHRLVVTVHKEIEQLCLSQDIPVLLHPFPDRNDMIRLGMGEISSFIDRCAFLPSDQPMILPETIASLLLCAKICLTLSGAPALATQSVLR